MRVVTFYHSLVSDWNNGNAHFLRGVAAELIARGIDVTNYESRDAWSVQNLIAEQGEKPLEDFHKAYPSLNCVRYDANTLDLEEALSEADLVLVHEWNDPELVYLIGQHRSFAADPYVLLFHDTHHGAVTDWQRLAAYDLTSYDGVLAFGAVIRDLYLRKGWTGRAWTWHEAADTRVFHPLPSAGREGDLVWIGNWGDEERAAELHEFLLEPVQRLGLKARVYGVRYPEEALAALERAGIEYAGWLPNYQVPAVLARFRLTIHVPRRPYVERLPGIPTIRPFEALACGIPLVCSPWRDTERLFTTGQDFLVANDGDEMQRHLQALLEDEPRARELAQHGLKTVRARHSCAHRVNELLSIYSETANVERELALMA
ncbi:MAG TPA: glycosyltransferase [Pyrinomonadaceae bacterium]|nr:glycosyltransferase [Pyrinomonadaceae bacterium]